jgi:tyrosyl-tRNA synthetase
MQRLKAESWKLKDALVEQIGWVKASEGDSVLDVVVSSWLAESRGDAKKLIQQNGISLNEVVVSDINRVIESSDWVNGVILLQKGKKNMRLVVR